MLNMALTCLREVKSWDSTVRLETFISWAQTTWWLPRWSCPQSSSSWWRHPVRDPRSPRGCPNEKWLSVSYRWLLFLNSAAKVWKSLLNRCIICTNDICETYQLFASTYTYIDYQLLNLFYFFNNIVKEVHQTSEKSEKMVFKSWWVWQQSFQWHRSCHVRQGRRNSKLFYPSLNKCCRWIA